MSALPPVAAPALNAWTAPISLVLLRLDQTSGLQIALNGAGPDDEVAFWFAQNPALNPTVNGPVEMVPVRQLPLSGGVARIRGPKPRVISLSTPTPPPGTVLYAQRTNGTTPGINILIAGQKATGGGGGGSTPTAQLKNQAANPVVANGVLAMAAVIVGTPLGYVGVSVNGAWQNVGDGVTNQDCYFSGDGGVTARAQGAIHAGDQLYWNALIPGSFPLAGTDLISDYYNT